MNLQDYKNQLALQARDFEAGKHSLRILRAHKDAACKIYEQTLDDLNAEVALQEDLKARNLELIEMIGKLEKK